MINHIRSKKSLGQNFLKDLYYIRKIADVAQISKHDQVLEIGPGLGHLTQELAARSKTVLAIELDERLILSLRKEFASMQSVEIVHADALEYPYNSLPGTWKVVANLPYYISTPLIQRLVASRPKFTSFTLTLQKEVAERIAAKPGGREYGYLSVLVQLFAVPHIEFRVPAGAFTPRPEVDSAVINMTVRDRPAVEIANIDFFFRVVKAGFSQRRKTLGNALVQIGLPKAALKQALSEALISGNRRAETLSLQEFASLADALYSKVIENK